VVERRSQVVGGSGRGAHDNEVGGCARCDEELLALSPQSRAHLVEAGGNPCRAVAALPGHRIDQSLALAHLDGAQLDEVTAQGCLRDVETLSRQDLQELALGSHALASEDVQDQLTPARPRLGYHVDTAETSGAGVAREQK
jgi:hypothetical protein